MSIQPPEFVAAHQEFKAMVERLVATPGADPAFVAMALIADRAFDVAIGWLDDQYPWMMLKTDAAEQLVTGILDVLVARGALSPSP